MVVNKLHTCEVFIIIFKNEMYLHNTPEVSTVILDNDLHLHNNYDLYIAIL